MSKIGNKPIQIPDKVEVNVQGNKVVVRGPKGELELETRPEVKVEKKEDVVRVSKISSNSEASAYWGLTRALIANMVVGVTEGYKKELELVGIGFRAAMNGKNLVLSVGFSHPVEYQPREGVEISALEGGKILVSGIDKYQVMQSAADIRKIKPPEPYKGKGIKYIDEIISKKAGKAGKVGGGLGE